LKQEAVGPAFELWLRKDHLEILTEGGAALLQGIQKYGSISKAAKQTGISYKHAWDRLAEIEAALGQPILCRKRGGRTGGGAELTETALALLKLFNRIKRYIGRALNDPEYWQAVALKISARNRFKGIIENVEKGAVTSSIKIKVQGPVTITALISKEAVEDLELEPGDKVEAVIKATEVMVAKE